MGKKGVSRISGPTHPTLGEKVTYKVTEWYPSTPLNERNSDKITWELFRKRNDGKYTTTNIKKKGIGNFTFTENAENFTYKIEGYLHRPEGKEPMAIIVHPQKSQIQKDKTKEILGIALTHQDGSKITKPLSYMDRLKAVAKCKNMVGEKIVFTLWEDDESGAGHNTKNQYIAKSKEIIVDSKGNARWEFALFNTYIKLANLREDDTKQHEYYVMIEYDKKPTASQNVNVNNPEYKNKPTEKPKPKPDSAKGSSNSNSKNNQPDKKGEVSSVKLLNAKKTPITKATFGDTIYVQIKGSNLDKKKYSLKIWEDDDFGKNDLLYTGEHIFSTNTYQEVKVTLTDEFRKIGELGNDPKNPDKGEYLTGNYQEIFAEVELLTQVTKSAIIEVSLKAKPTPPEQTIAAAVIGKLDKKKEENTTCVCKQYDLIWGNKVSCEFRKKVIEIAKRQNFNPNDLMAVMKVETSGTFSPSKIELKETNEKRKDGKYKKEYRGLTKDEIMQLSENFSGAVGLIQFTPAAIKSLNDKYNYSLTKRKIALMSDLKQLDYVEKYIEQWKDLKNISGKISLSDLYVLVFAPNYFGTSDNTTLYKEGSEYYKANESVDTDGKNGITKKEISERAYTSYSEGESQKENKFICTKKEIEKPKESNNTSKDMLSKYLSYNQAIASDTAKKNGLDNTPNKSEIENLKYLGLYIYDKIYENFKGNVMLTSVYRSEDVNKKVGGSKTSQHRFGQALDIKGTNGVSNKQIYKYVKENLDYHQIIWEFGTESEPSWVHVGYKPKGNQKKNTRALSVKGKTKYITFDLKI